tara:strand:- start:1258 stop:1665 length:408 start_codon:yes stop_codon:yes gene_type:complete
MHKVELGFQKISDSIFNLLAIIIILLLFIKTNIVYGLDTNWIEVSKTETGIQYWDSNSLISKDKGIIEIRTRYLRMADRNLGKVEDNIYTMKINCINNKYKDISINGKKTLNQKWEGHNGDKLIKDVIKESCKNV